MSRRRGANVPRRQKHLIIIACCPEASMLGHENYTPGFPGQNYEGAGKLSSDVVDRSLLPSVAQSCVIPKMRHSGNGPQSFDLPTNLLRTSSRRYFATQRVRTESARNRALTVGPGVHQQEPVRAAPGHRAVPLAFHRLRVRPARAESSASTRCMECLACSCRPSCSVQRVRRCAVRWQLAVVLPKYSEPHHDIAFLGRSHPATCVEVTAMEAMHTKSGVDEKLETRGSGRHAPVRQTSRAPGPELCIRQAAEAVHERAVHAASTTAQRQPGRVERSGLITITGHSWLRTHPVAY